MSIEDRSSNVPAGSGTSELHPLLPAKFSADVAEGGTSEERRRLIRKIIVGVPAVVAMTARGATAGHGGGGDILAASAPSTPS
jgi:hypothetical protein